MMLTFYILPLLLASSVFGTPGYKSEKDELLSMAMPSRESPRRMSKRIQEYPPEQKPYVEYEPLDDEFEQPIEKEEAPECKYIPLPTRRNYLPRRQKASRTKYGAYESYDSLFENRIPAGRAPKQSRPAQPEYIPELPYENDQNQPEPAAEDEAYEHQPKEAEPLPPPTFERVRSQSRPRKMNYKRLFAQDPAPSNPRREYFEPEEQEDSKYDTKYERPSSAPSRPAARPVSCNEDDENYETTECDCS